MEQMEEHHDLLILGAGVSGINTAYILQTEMPHRKITILEKRPCLGGTWSFFKYPGFRNDSSMTAFGFRWHTWKDDQLIAPSPSILKYVDEAAREHGIKDKIRFNHEALGFEWTTEEQKWRVRVNADGMEKTYVANFVFVCMGYYSYDKAMPAEIPGIESFGGKVVHAQWWPEDLQYAGKRIIVIGSGATAVTMLPALAKEASHVTMLQRSPSYVVSRPSRISFIERIARALGLSWHLSILEELLFVTMLPAWPKLFRHLLKKKMEGILPEHVDASVHFNPRYYPLEQRVCICPDEDFFQALQDKDRAEVVTGVIKRVSEKGIELEGEEGRVLPADIIVTATGLYVQLVDGKAPVVDGVEIWPGEHYSWRGSMLDSLPNMCMILGYVTSSWTPGASIMARQMVEVLRKMEREGATSVMPVIGEGERRQSDGEGEGRALKNKSTYFLSAMNRVPKATGEGPWYGRVNLMVDMLARWFGNVDDGLVYGGGGDERKRK